MLVYVLDIHGRPLMPTKRFGKVRRMLRDGRAKVVRKEPLTIKLLYESENEVQELTLGVDTGSSKIGCAVVNNKQEVLYLSEVEIRNDISQKMGRRRASRRNRRSRKTRYRPARFNNRGNSIKKGRLNPTMTSKRNSHIREIEFIKKLLPITRLILETGTFDPHLLKMQEEGKPFNLHWGYQKGPNYGFANAKAACLNRDNYTCQCCKTKKGTLHAHHIVYRSNGGADTLDNLITLCEDCHKKLHRGELTTFEAKLNGKKKGQLNHATQMNHIRKLLLADYPEAEETFGYITKANREHSSLEKTHFNDAITIACGCIPEPKILSYLYRKKHVAKGDYQLTKGVRGEIKIPTGKLCGFRKFDKVRYFGKEYYIKGRMTAGYATLMDICGNKIDFLYMSRGNKTPKLNNLTRLAARGSTLCTQARIMVNTV